jgi:2-hydroxy-3-oxopropionate reductase
MSKQSLNIGFIGLGIMGAPMAGTCRRRPQAVRQHPGPDARGCASRRGHPLPQRKAVAQAADIIIVMVPDTPDVGRCCSARAAWPRACPRASW